MLIAAGVPCHAVPSSLCGKPMHQFVAGLNPDLAVRAGHAVVSVVGLDPESVGAGLDFVVVPVSTVPFHGHRLLIAELEALDHMTSVVPDLHPAIGRLVQGEVVDGSI